MKTLEIAVFNIESALLAQSAGADRIELCENPFDGGTTPSYGTLKSISEKIQIPVFPIIRPRGGDFLYSDDEFEVMKQDLIMIKSLGFKGAVIGLLNADGHIDTIRTKELVDLAADMEITFHRAFDRCIDPLQSLEDVIATGCKRILTSGQKPNVNDALPLITQLIKKADNRIIILPGSGVRAQKLSILFEETGASECHSSARMEATTKMQFIVESMNENLTSTLVDENEVIAMKKITQSFKN
ncbi:copper homeostasis protein CutC [Rhizosphaericola mali]|uniref:PF03932 family protein CutC n=1 Tax=Rhizosphaericola mali TaxID=2545455 RepID=A0A5P2G7A3_9BACT|nr:copper homeostasis protein CutC [Rhizosphaericola mali]QES90578.1 copper homeostasis protein CutC [Rhizosphaericola mali]